jgi:hypothetical protein
MAAAPLPRKFRIAETGQPGTPINKGVAHDAPPARKRSFRINEFVKSVGSL